MLLQDCLVDYFFQESCIKPETGVDNTDKTTEEDKLL